MYLLKVFVKWISRKDTSHSIIGILFIHILDTLEMLILPTVYKSLSFLL